MLRAAQARADAAADIDWLVSVSSGLTSKVWRSSGRFCHSAMPSNTVSVTEEMVCLDASAP